MAELIGVLSFAGIDSTSWDGCRGHVLIGWVEDSGWELWMFQASHWLSDGTSIRQVAY